MLTHERPAPVQPKLLSAVDTDASLRLCLAAEVCPTSVSLGIHEFASVDFTDAVNCILPGAAGVPHSARKYVAELATLRDLGGLVTHPFSACRKPQFARSFSAVPRLISPALPFTSTACSAWIYEQHDASLCAPAFGPCSSAWLPVARQFPARSSQAFRM